MSGTSLLPIFGGRFPGRADDGDPTLPFRREMNRVFENFFGDFGLSSMRLRPPAPVMAVVLTPRIEVSETDKEIRITAEMPGIDPKNLNITLQDDVLTLRAEKTEEQESQDRNYHVAERSYGTFTRYLRLPFKVDPGQVRAVVRDGVLMITVPKPQEAQQKAHRIEISQQTGSSDQKESERAPQPEGSQQQRAGQQAAINETAAAE